MTEAAAPTTLRDTIEQAYDAVEPPAAVETPALESPAPEKTAEAPAPVETEAQRTERLRDEKGRFVEGKSPAPAAKPAAAVVSPPVQAQVEPPPVPRPNRPSSWKKDYWEQWDKLDPKVAEYILQREGEYAKGVSTYKGEYDRAKPIMEALAPHMPDFERMGINPAQQMARYAEIHKTLAMGNPQQRLGLFAQLVRDYQIPVEQMLIQGADGKIYVNQQLMQQAAATPAPQQTAPTQNIDQVVEAKLAQREAVRETQSFREAKDTTTGTLLHPHFEEVRETMAQLLDAKLVDDIPKAYEAALKLPQHANLYEQEQQQRTARAETERLQKSKEAAERAKHNAVSTKSATPAGATTAGATKGVRAAVESAVEQHMTGRV